MKKSWVIIIAILVLIGIIIFVYYGYNRGYFDGELRVCKVIQSKSLSDVCVGLLAVKRNDVSICKKAFNGFLIVSSEFQNSSNLVVTSIYPTVIQNYKGKCLYIQ